MAISDENSGCLSAIFPFLKVSQKGKTLKVLPSLKNSQKEKTPKALPYRLRDDFLSPAEFSFYKVLSSLVGARFTIQSKVRLVDVFLSRVQMKMPLTSTELLKSI